MSPSPQADFAVTNRTVLKIAVPMTLAYLTTPLLGLVGTGVVGHFGQAALLGGLAAGALVFDVVFTTFNFLRSGTTGLVAQALGRGDLAEQQAVFWRASIIALLAGLALLALSPLIRLTGGAFIGGDPDVSHAMDAYVRIRMLGAPLTLINYAILGTVLGRGAAATGLALQVLLNGVNIGLALLLGLWLGWGVAGVAWATVAGEAAAVAAGVAVILATFRDAPPLSRARLMDLPALLGMVALNRDIMIRSFTLLAAFALFTREGAREGTVALAANAVLMNFFLVSGFFLDGFATAAEQLAGRAIGAGEESQFRRAVLLTCRWGFALAGLASVAFLLCGDSLVALMTTSTDVASAAASYLPWAALTAVCMEKAATGVLAFQMDGVFIGATWSRDMRNMMLLSFAAFVAAMFALKPLGNHGLWASLHVFLLTRGLSLAAILPRRMRETFARS